jgi:hypothetical protein
LQISINRRRLSLAAFDHQSRNAVIRILLMNSPEPVRRSDWLTKSRQTVSSGKSCRIALDRFADIDMSFDHIFRSANLASEFENHCAS